MKNKCKIRIALIFFAIAAIAALYFVLLYQPSVEITIYNDNPNNNTENNSTNKESADNNSAKESTEETDRQLILDKWKGKDISQVKTDKKAIALTFDGGANADGVERILSILKDNGIKGTFFLTGQFIEKYPDKTKLILESGGEVGNHSYSHPYFTKLTDKEIKTELERTESGFSKLNATFQPFFRFPYGDRNEETISKINEDGYIAIRWTVDSLGWKGASGGMTKESVENRVISKTAPGAIILMHLGTNPDDKTQLDSDALPEIISGLKSQGYDFVTITEILASWNN